jgi:hypothetical protein
VGHERHPEHVACDPGRFVHSLCQLDAATLTASARMDLRLHDDGTAAEPARDVGGLVGGHGDLSARHRDAVLSEQGLGLIFVDFQGKSLAPARLPAMRVCGPHDAMHLSAGSPESYRGRDLRVKQPSAGHREERRHATLVRRRGAQPPTPLRS